MSRNPRRTSRRQFTKLIAGSALGTFAAPGILRARNPNDKLNIAVIGAGGRGAADTRQVNSENIVALCDVNEKNLNQAAKRYPKARKLVDFREVFDHANEFDAVIVATCEHTHAMATMLALKHKKHVYCEKPLTHDVWEARQIRLAARKAGVATQMGIQIHAGNNYREVVELIQTGAIGPVREVHVWVSRAWGWQSKEDAKKNHDRVFVTERPKESMPIPPGLHWDLWLGPAPYRPFNEVYFPGPKWYRWWDFGNGTMSDLGSHWIDLPFWALKLDFPRTIEASGPKPNPEIAPASMTATYEYGRRGDLPPVKLTWYQGTYKPDIWEKGDIPKWPNGHLFIGEKGMILSDYGKHMLLPKDQFADFKKPEPLLPRITSHHGQWVEACKHGTPTGANFEYSGLLTEANHLGNVAFLVGKKLHWDPVKMQVTNAPEAANLIRRPYRGSWQLG